MEAALLLLFALAVLIFVVPSAPAGPAPERIVIIVPHSRSATPGLGIILVLLALIVAVILIGQ